MALTSASETRPSSLASPRRNNTLWLSPAMVCVPTNRQINVVKPRVTFMMCPPIPMRNKEDPCEIKKLSRAPAHCQTGVHSKRHAAKGSGRRRGVAPRRPPTPPYVRFRIRRFLFNNSSRGLFGQGLRGQVGSENESEPPDSWGWRQHSTRDLGHSSHGSTLSRAVQAAASQFSSSSPGTLPRPP
jgi:hypothetical protein